MSHEANGWSPSKRRPHVPPAATQISTGEALAMLAHVDSVSNLDKPPTPPITPDDALYMNGTTRFSPQHVAKGYHYAADMSNYYKDKDIRTLDRFNPLKTTASSLLGKLRVHHLGSERDHLPTVDRAPSSPKKSYPPGSLASYAQQLLSVVFSLQSLVSSDTLKFCVLCFLWYASSAVTNNIGKQILNQFRFPVTLTFVQFGFVAVYCFVFGQLFGMTRIRRPTREIIESTLPLSVFQIVGHVFSSVAISRVPVSFVHTIKALSPLFTVLIYRFFFGISYSSRVYTSLLPLTLGVMLACTFQFTNNAVGLLCALGSCVIFVTQNIFSKKLLFKESKGDRRNAKLDKTNLLFYSSAMAFALMAPLWFYTDCSILLSDIPLSSLGHGVEPVGMLTIVFYFFLNGSSHFFQNIFAFNVLALTSPVTYSIASLVKRIFVIVASIIWFGQSVSGLQWVGIILTFGGLWMYQAAKRDIDRGENRLLEKEVGNILPVATFGFNK